MAESVDPLLDALRSPGRLTALSLPQWDTLVRMARRAGLLARLGAWVDELGLLAAVPPAPRQHLLAARLLAAAQADAVRREIDHVVQALQALDVPVVLLKGAAYVAAGLPSAAGRLFSDVDILVPQARLAEVEAALMAAGWATTHPSAYDQHYYRTWMHELPPMQHIHRHTVLDVHHAILPRTARLKPDSDRLLAAATPLPGPGRLHVLAPADLVLHSATHLFHDDELGHGLRDLSDIDLLLRHFAQADSGFWARLQARAGELGLSRPLHYALGAAARLLDTPVPAPVLDAAARSAPPWPLAPCMDRLWSRALRPADGPALHVTRFALYVRAHWLRMPPLLLARHLLVKAMRREAR